MFFFMSYICSLYTLQYIKANFLQGRDLRSHFPRIFIKKLKNMARIGKNVSLSSSLHSIRLCNKLKASVKFHSVSRF